MNEDKSIDQNKITNQNITTNQNQIISETINDIDDFVIRLSDKIDSQHLETAKEYKNQIKINTENGSIDIAQDICSKAILFMQNYEISLIENQQKDDEKNMLADLMLKTNIIGSNTDIIDGKITDKKSNFIKNIYYKYFYKGQSQESDFDESKFIFNILDNIYQLLISCCIVAILCFVFINKLTIHNYYQIYALGFLALCIYICQNTKTESNISIVIDLFVIGCFAFTFWLSKLFFALY